MHEKANNNRNKKKLKIFKNGIKITSTKYY